ncbi:MAG: tetratricopeptide repeat protein, partial [Bdellovibrionota bacterium]
IMLTVLGTWGTGWFLLKSLAFGALTAVSFRGLRSFGVNRENALISVSLLTLSTATLSAILWHSDFVVYSELVVASTLFWIFPKIEKYKITSRDWLILLACVYFGGKIKAEVRLVPVILLATLAIFRRDSLKKAALPLIGIFAASIPWSAAILQKAPPFIPGASGWSGTTYRPFSLERMLDFLVRGVFDLRQPSTSVLAAGGILFALAAAAYVGYRIYREKLESPNLRSGFFLVWLSVMILGCATLPNDPNGDLRLTMVPLLPAILMLGIGLQAAEKEFGRFKYFRPALLSVLALQLAFHGYQDFRLRMNMGHRIVAAEKLMTLVETKYSNSQFVSEPDFGQPGFHDSQAASIARRQTLPHPDFIDRYPAGNTFAASWSPSLDPRLTVVEEVSGCGSAFFDLIVGCGARDSAVLMRYIGTPTELTAADKLDKQGKLFEARQVLEGYLQKDPGNYGLGFILSLYTSRQGDFARLEKLYDWLGEGFPQHPNILYNWGIAKVGLSKYPEAAKLFERAYALSPHAYEIGFNLADSYYRQGRKSRAIATLNDLMKSYPGNQNLMNTISNWKK